MPGTEDLTRYFISIFAGGYSSTILLKLDDKILIPTKPCSVHSIKVQTSCMRIKLGAKNKRTKNRHLQYIFKEEDFFGGNLQNSELRSAF